MGFKCGIVGLPNVGKSTLFNALTESNNAEAANYPFATIEPNIGRVPVPDKRLLELNKISKSIKMIPTFIDFVDIAGLVKGASKGEGLGNKFLSHVKEVDAIAHVVRCFDDENITHVSSSINPEDDIDIIETELILADLQTLENKINAISKQIKGGDKKYKEEAELIKKIQDKLNNNESIKNMDIPDELKDFTNSLNLISNKPMLFICNVDEESIINGNKYSEIVKKKASKESNKVVIVSAAIESQIAEFKEEKDKVELLKDIGLTETTLSKVIVAGYSLLNLNTFFTSGPKESRAWTIKKNSTAPEAAGKIHTDFKKGFIKAETISYEDFIKYNGEINCRNEGKLRQEGREYIVKDGDIFHFLFNV
tara:strand:- start:1869 stop:2969 length:1101 start_codon:yes stop_codon:yes gene_type:complete